MKVKMESKTVHPETPGALEPMAMLDEDQPTDSEYSSSDALSLECLKEANPNRGIEADSASQKPIKTSEKTKLLKPCGVTPFEQDVGTRAFDKPQTLVGGVILGGAEILSHVENEEKSFAPSHFALREKPQANSSFSELGDPSKSVSGVGLESLLSLLVCPITKKVFREPCTLVADGWTYERGALIAWFQLGYDISPTTGEKLYGTAFADSRSIKRLISKLQPDRAECTQFPSEWLRNCVRLHYEILTSPPVVAKEEAGVIEANLAEAVGKLNLVSTPPSNRRRVATDETVNVNNRGGFQVVHSTNSLIALSKEPQLVRHSSPLMMKSLSHPLPLQPLKMDKVSTHYSLPFSDTISRNWSYGPSPANLEMPSIQRCGSHNRESELLKKLSEYPQKGTWTMEESTNFWYVCLDDEWQGDEFRSWIVHETELTVGSIRNEVWHKLAEEWADKLKMPRSSIGWFTPPFYGNLKIPVHNSIKNPSKEFKKGETIRFNLERLLIRDAAGCRYGPDDGNLPIHLPHQRTDNGRSSYATAMFSVSVRFVRDDVMPASETGEYYCNLSCYGVRGALVDNVVNLSKEGGLQPGELPSSRLSELMQKISQTDGIGTLVQRGSNWFCVLRKLWQDKREQFLNQAKKDFKDAEFYHKFLVPYRNCSFYSEFCKQQPEEDFMKWTSEDKEFQVALGELDSAALDNVNTINFNIPYLQYAIAGEKLMINAKVVFPDLSRRGRDEIPYHFTIATVIPACTLKHSPTPRETFEEL